MGLCMVFCDREGRIYDHPHLLPAGYDGPEPRALNVEDLIPVPEGSDMMILPGRHAIGIDPETKAPVVFSSWERKPAYAAAVFMAPAHTQSHRAAYVSEKDAPVLPLYAYTAVAFDQGRFYAAGARVDPDERQNPTRFDLRAVESGVTQVLKELGNNRVANQLKKCALEYKCRAAQNFFLGRHEAPLPTSIACNSKCVGCLSLQEDGEFRAAHDRFRIPPKADEIAEVALRHIERVDRAVVSFGQGCEGEPLIGGESLQQAIRTIRQRTADGTINLNTNASKPETVEKLIDAGLDSMRVSLNSLRESLYTSYYRPRGYVFADVLRSIDIARRRGVFVSLNLLYFPGVTDTRPEVDAISELMNVSGVNLIQLRNLNIDPELYIRSIPAAALQEGFGVKKFMNELREKFPDVRFGYFNPPKETFHSTNLP
jgi:pyruvate-formate lyase-activating enzyme